MTPFLRLVILLAATAGVITVLATRSWSVPGLLLAVVCAVAAVAQWRRLRDRRPSGE